ncbi:hypothetical protein G7046_g9178 [Stylonectria norvegica]|nr:hypothetical protein G7046_g9178 [Stylonectria norvegica]
MEATYGTIGRAPFHLRSTGLQEATGGYRRLQLRTEWRNWIENGWIEACKLETSRRPPCPGTGSSGNLRLFGIADCGWCCSLVAATVLLTRARRITSTSASPPITGCKLATRFFEPSTVDVSPRSRYLNGVVILPPWTLRRKGGCAALQIRRPAEDSETTFQLLPDDELPLSTATFDDVLTLDA